MTHDPRAIAEGLTKASKRALPHLSENWSSGESTSAIFNGVYSLGWGKDGHRGLIYRRWPNGSLQVRLTPLGLQVRQILKERQP